MKIASQANTSGTKANVTASPVKFRKSSLPPFDADAHLAMAIGAPAKAAHTPPQEQANAEPIVRDVNNPDALYRDAARYKFLRDSAFLQSANCKADFAALAEKMADCHGDQFDALIDSIIAAATLA